MQAANDDWLHHVYGHISLYKTDYSANVFFMVNQSIVGFYGNLNVNLIINNMFIFMESTLVHVLLSLTIYHRLKYSYTMIVRHCII